MQDVSKKYQQNLLSSIYPDQSSAGWLGLFTQNMTSLNTGMAVYMSVSDSFLNTFHIELSNFLHENVAAEMKRSRGKGIIFVLL